jgi:hypothetical protein
LQNSTEPAAPASTSTNGAEGSTPDTQQPLIQDTEQSGADPEGTDQDYSDPSKILGEGVPGIADQDPEGGAGQAPEPNVQDLKAPATIPPPDLTAAEQIATADGAMVITIVEEIPIEAAAYLLAYVMRRRGFRAFAIPQQVTDKEGTVWQVLGRMGGYALYGMANHTRLAQWAEEKRRLEEERAPAAKAARSADSYERELLGKIEFQRQQQIELAKQQGKKITKATDNVESIRELKRELAEARDRNGPAMKLVAEIDERLEKHEAAKPRDVRYLYEFDRELSQLLITARPGN